MTTVTLDQVIRTGTAIQLLGTLKGLAYTVIAASLIGNGTPDIGPVTATLTGAWPEPRGPVQRANTRYVSAAGGNDANDGLSWGTAWATVKVASLPPSCRVVIDNGTYPFVYDDRSDPGFPQGVTLDALNPRQVFFDGTGTGAGDAFALYSYQRDLEIRGIVFQNYANGFGNGCVTQKGDIEGLRVINCKFRLNGDGAPVKNDHNAYHSTGGAWNASPRNFIWEHNEMEMSHNANNGAVLAHFYGGSGYMTHDGFIRYNTARGTCAWAIIAAQNRGTEPCNIQITDNDIRGAFSVAAIEYYAEAPGSGGVNGVDSSFVVERNVIVQMHATAPVTRRTNVLAGGSNHAPTHRNNIYWHTNGGTIHGGGAAALSNGTGDVVKDPTLEPIVAIYVVNLVGLAGKTYAPRVVITDFNGTTNATGSAFTIDGGGGGGGGGVVDPGADPAAASIWAPRLVTVGGADAGRWGSRYYSAPDAPTPEITTDVLPSGRVGSLYLTGISGTFDSATARGLPPGLRLMSFELQLQSDSGAVLLTAADAPLVALTGSTGGHAIYGTPTLAGTYQVQITPYINGEAGPMVTLALIINRAASARAASPWAAVVGRV